ncbi:site-specific integrase [Amycolatopsis rhabdoformis]|uniref:Site-specific integrase n=1 Tax=Amycolatopsis rhabdoformis TaxID=1448059 RepID=A0ABZ1I186_9PSEU|nr:site-specific integrase [Amycolatopsis rhabdoformis]WSE27909.1 site-specific integrase [Amycolatopsis rhabdoformis]
MPRKKRPEGTRAPNGASTVYFSETDGHWHGRVTVGKKDNGNPDRRHTMSKDETKVRNKVREWENERDEGRVRKAGQNWTVETWLNHWLHEIMAPPTITENAWDAYEVACRVHLVPGVGAHRLQRSHSGDKLEPEHLEKLYRRMTREGSSAGRVHQVHRTIRTALKEAKKRKIIADNPAELARAPKVEEVEYEPYDVDEIQRVLETANRRRNSARWAIALALGLRQGEALGIQWPDVNWDRWDRPCKKHGSPFCAACFEYHAPEIGVRRNRLRPKYKHGCLTPCGRKFAGYCPQRVSARRETAPTKSRAGKRYIGLPKQLALLLVRHQAAHAQERALAADLWEETGYVFTKPTGQPLVPNTDYHHWKELLRDAKVGERRLHDARHTAATVLLLLEVPERTVMSIMGWSSTAMAARYQHVTDRIRRGVAGRVDGLLWAPPNDAAGADDEPREVA